MAINKSPNGTYKVSYSKRHPVTRVPVSRQRKGINSRAEAKRIYADLVVLVNDILKKQVIPIWSVFLDEYIIHIDQLNELTKGTVYKRDKVLKKFTLKDWGHKCIDEITAQDIRDIIYLKMSEASEQHKKFVIKSIKAVMEYAVEKGFLDRNPTPKIKFKIKDKIKAVLNEKQILTLLRRAQELSFEWYPHYAVAVFTGMRSGELYALTWEQVDLENRQIRVDRAWALKDGVKSTKSGHDRITMIPEPLMPVLRELQLNNSGDPRLVLPRLKRWDQGGQSKILRSFLESIGLPSVKFHDLRASWATLLLSKGVAPSQVMAMGGWSDMKTMMGYMRKAGIDVSDATKCLDHLHIHHNHSCKVLSISP